MQKKIPWMLFMLQGIKSPNPEEVYNIFTEFARIGNSDTCLKPLKVVLKGMGFDVLHCQTWPEVHQYLHEKNIHCKVVSVDPRTSYVFPIYSHHDVLQYIRSLT
jgi:hypothetical protein